MMTVPCPCCGQPFVATKPNALMFTSEFVKTGRTRGRVLDALCSYYPRAISMQGLIDHCYWDDPSGGPLDAEKSIRVTIVKLRKITEPLGWVIASRYGVGYCLIHAAEMPS